MDFFRVFLTASFCLLSTMALSQDELEWKPLSSSMIAALGGERPVVDAAIDESIVYEKPILIHPDAQDDPSSAPRSAPAHFSEGLYIMHKGRKLHEEVSERLSALDLSGRSRELAAACKAVNELASKVETEVSALRRALSVRAMGSQDALKLNNRSGPVETANDAPEWIWSDRNEDDRDANYVVLERLGQAAGFEANFGRNQSQTNIRDLICGASDDDNVWVKGKSSSYAGRSIKSQRTYQDANKSLVTPKAIFAIRQNLDEFRPRNWKPDDGTVEFPVVIHEDKRTSEYIYAFEYLQVVAEKDDTVRIKPPPLEEDEDWNKLIISLIHRLAESRNLRLTLDSIYAPYYDFDLSDINLAYLGMTNVTLASIRLSNSNIWDIQIRKSTLGKLDAKRGWCKLPPHSRYGQLTVKYEFS